MSDLCGVIWRAIAALFWSRAALQAEIPILNVLRSRSPKRVALSSVDRLVFVGLYRLATKVLDALTIPQPETVIRWYRAVSEPIGAGNQDIAWAGQRFSRTLASSFPT
jgi:hypothetical protein